MSLELLSYFFHFSVNQRKKRKSTGFSKRTSKEGMAEILKIYKILLKEFKEQGWWPVNGKYHTGYSKPGNEEEVLEISLGAILTQNTSWKNVEKALTELRKKNLINLNNLKNINVKELAETIKSSGYNNQKARKIKELAEFLCSGKEITREGLLEIWGIGPETADSILLYGHKKPIFVIDAYTKRILERIGFKEKSYDELQNLFVKNLENDFKIFNEYHALLVKLGKDYCKKEPLCGKCPLRKSCSHGINA